jgi:type IV pilus assembly protein PilC
MQVFRYKGYDSLGKKVEGEMAAATIDEVERKVSQQSITVIAIFPAGAIRKAPTSESAGTAFAFGRKKVSDADIAVVLRDLAVMSETGVPFVEALDAVILTARTPTLQAGLRKLKDEVVGGRGLSAGMRNAGVFPVIVSEMVKVAEEGGRLDKALASAATYVERAADLRKKVMNAMLYPIVLSCIAFATLVIMITFVLPRFANIFKTMKTEVPAITQFLLGIGDTIKGHPIPVIGGFLALLVLGKVAWSTPRIHRAISGLLLKVPVLGELLRRLALSRAFQSISTLISSNVSLMSAMEHGAKVAGNPVIEEALLKARGSIEHGVSLSDALTETKAFPITLVQMVSVGERTGRLGLLMSSTASHMEEDVDSRLKALISIVEPLMIVVMGGIVGLITMSIIIPMYSVIENVK